MYACLKDFGGLTATHVCLAYGCYV